MSLKQANSSQLVPVPRSADDVPEEVYERLPRNLQAKVNIDRTRAARPGGGLRGSPALDDY